MTTASPLDRVVVVLVEPLQPGNVGAAARAMKNMGLSKLIIVAPPSFDPHRARWMAPGCDDILAQMRIVATLDEALAGVTRAIATTARHRRHGQPVLEPRELAQTHFEGADDEVTALLFGREDHGLPASAVERCAALLRIPTPEHASLNLAQAVLLVAHALFEEGRHRGVSASGRTVSGSHGAKSTLELTKAAARADLVELEPVVQEILGLLAQVGSAPPAVKGAITVRGALQRAALSKQELGALRGLVQRVARRAMPSTASEDDLP
jgi:tRNA (cytidine32/uridine32-2'-O)-methyltransferase